MCAPVKLAVLLAKKLNFEAFTSMNNLEPMGELLQVSYVLESLQAAAIHARVTNT